jgi:hypothetical protein
MFYASNNWMNFTDGMEYWASEMEYWASEVVVAVKIKFLLKSV